MDAASLWHNSCVYHVMCMCVMCTHFPHAYFIQQFLQRETVGTSLLGRGDDRSILPVFYLVVTQIVSYQ